MNTRRLLLYILIMCSVPALARQRTLPADSIALVTQMFDQSKPLPDVNGLITYGKKDIALLRWVDCMAHVPLTRRILVNFDVVEGATMGCFYKVRVSGLPKPRKMTLRVPLAPGRRYFVNGHPAFYSEKNGSVIIRREWQNGDEILVQ